MDMPDQIKPYFRWMGYLSVGVLVADVTLSAMFGFNIGILPGIVMALISLGSGILLVIAAYLHCAGQRAIAIALCSVWVPMFMFNVMSNMGVATANRMQDVQQAVLQQARFKEVEQSKRETATELAVLKQSRETLKTKFSQLIDTKVGDWTVTTVPAETATLDKLIAEKSQERDREKGRNGCGVKCEARTAELNHLVALRGIAAQIQDTKERIAKVEGGLNQRREQLASTEAGISQTANQASLYVKLFSFATFNGWQASDNPEALNAANEGMGVFMALVLALTATGLSIATVWPSLMQVKGNVSRHVEPIKLQATTIPKPQPQQVVPVAPAQPDHYINVRQFSTVGQMNMERLRRIAGTAA